MATTDTASRVLTNNTRRFLPVWRPELGAKVLAGFTSDVDLLPGSQEAAFCCVPTWGLGVGRELPLFDLSRLHNSSLCLAFLCRGCQTDTAGWGLANRRHSLSMVLLAGHLRSRGQGRCLSRPLSLACPHHLLPVSSQGRRSVGVCVLVSSQKAPVVLDLGSTA